MERKQQNNLYSETGLLLSLEIQFLILNSVVFTYYSLRYRNIDDLQIDQRVVGTRQLLRYLMGSTWVQFYGPDYESDR